MSRVWKLKFLLFATENRTQAGNPYFRLQPDFGNKIRLHRILRRRSICLYSTIQVCRTSKRLTTSELDLLAVKITGTKSQLSEILEPAPKRMAYCTRNGASVQFERCGAVPGPNRLEYYLCHNLPASCTNY